MKTNCGFTRIDTDVQALARLDGKPLVHEEISRIIIGAAMEVLNTLGCGFSEKIYEKAIVVELLAKQLKIEQQKRFAVRYKNVEVGEYIPDLLVENKVIVDTKVVESIRSEHQAQMLNYLAVTGLKLGLIINFRRPKLEYQRIVR